MTVSSKYLLSALLDCLTLNWFMGGLGRARKEVNVPKLKSSCLIYIYCAMKRRKCLAGQEEHSYDIITDYGLMMSRFQILYSQNLHLKPK